MTVLERIPAQVTLKDDGRTVLRTQRLILRAPRLADAPAVADLIGDRRIAENTARVPHPYALADAEAFIAYIQGGGERSFLVTLSDDTIVGCCGVGQLRGDVPEIGYWFGVAYWGYGYATKPRKR